MKLSLIRLILAAGGEESAVAHAAELMVTENAVLSDSSRSKDTHMNPAHASVTSLRCVHQFVRSQMNLIHDSVIKVRLFMLDYY